MPRRVLAPWYDCKEPNSADAVLARNIAQRAPDAHAIGKKKNRRIRRPVRARSNSRRQDRDGTSRGAQWERN